MSAGAPNIEDSGFDGCDISHLIDLSEAGSWEAVLPYCINIRILPSGRTEGLRGGAPLVSPHTPATLKGALDAGEDGGQPLPAFAPDVLGLHADPIAKTNRDNPHGR